MKSQPTTFNSGARPRFLRATCIAGLLPALVFLLSVQSSHAGSATWLATPTTGDWNTAGNWTAGGPPNGPTDTGTFASSSTTGVSLSANTEVNGIVFNAGASPFMITVNFGSTFQTLTLSGIGIVNNSGITQDLVTSSNGGGSLSQIAFLNNATAGSSTVVYTINGVMDFFNNSTAGAAAFSLSGASNAGFLTFHDSSTAGTATFTTDHGASLAFDGSATTGANGIFINNHGGRTIFTDGDASNGNFTNNGSDGVTEGAYSTFDGGATADAATLTNNPGPAIFGGAGGGRTLFYDTATAGNATIIANGGDAGTDGGKIYFFQTSLGGTCRIEVFGNGVLDISGHGQPGVTIGSVEGDGAVFLGRLALTVGSNNLDTTYSGVLQNGGEYGGARGSLVKTGAGTLTLSGSSTYTGATTITAGTLQVANPSGSATGGGPVQTNAGTLGGVGRISGTVLMGTGTGTGAFLAPGTTSNTPGKLTIQKSLTFNADSTYLYVLKTINSSGDQVVTKGVTINSGAQFSFAATGTRTLAHGRIFTPINNTAATPISGTFGNLADGSSFTVGSNTYLVSYEGGTGNDLTLTVQ